LSSRADRLRQESPATILALKDALGLARTPQEFGALGNGNDDTAAFQAAIDWVVSVAVAAGRTYGLPHIKVPGGWYKLSDTLTMFPWVHFVADGPVYLDFTGIATSKPGVVCNNLTSIAQDATKFPANHAPFLNGGRGGFTIRGPGKATSTAPALKLGNFVSGGKAFRDARISNVVVTGWNVAQEFGKFDTYLFHAENCRFEDNNTQIKTSSGTSTNSGERMEWVHCTFAQSTVVLDHDVDAFDAFLYGCSFDFNGTVVKFGANSRYCAVSFPGGCHMEGITSYVVDGSPIPTGGASPNVTVVLSDGILLPSGASGDASVNSPSRTLFTGRFSLSLDRLKVRYVTRPYLEDGCPVAASVDLVSASGRFPSPYAGMFNVACIANPDADFQADADGTSGDVLAHWERVTITGTVSRDLFTTGGKKVLRLVGSTGADGSAIHFRSKRKITARGGDRFMVNLCANAGAATGAVNTFAWVEFFDDADVSLGNQPTFSTYSLRTALDDTTVPNYSSGNSRWMDTHAWLAVAPPNAAYGKMRFAIANFDGTAYVSRARMWRV